MDGSYNGYMVPGATNTTTSVWVGGAPNLMEPLVDQFGNLRFDNKIIPLTTPVNQFISPTPSVPNLASPPMQLSPVMTSPPQGPYYVVSVQESPPATVTSDPISTMKAHVQIPNGNYSTVGIIQNNSQENGNVVFVNQAAPPQQVVNGTRHPRQRYVSNPEIQPLHQPIQRKVSAPEPNQSPFRGQPYMRQLHIDHSNGEVIRQMVEEVPPMSSVRYVSTTQEDPYGGQGGRLVYMSTSTDYTDSLSSMSSTSVSPYNSVPSSPRPDPQGSSATHTMVEANKVVYDQVPPRYVKPSDNSRCLMCDKIVYAMEKRGPIKNVLFHKLCFKCAVCNMTLDLKNFCQNDDDLADLNVYCKSHKPVKNFGKLDAGALSINRALHAPRLSQVNEQIRGGPEAMKGGTMDTESLSIKSALSVPKPSLVTGENVRQTAHTYTIDNQDVSFVHARNVPATELHVANKKRAQVWSRDERKSESVPPPDVIRYDSEVQGYGGEPYRHDPPSESTYR